MNNSKFKFYEVVTVQSDNPRLHSIKGKKGAILGMVQGTQDKWIYAVQMLDDGEGWDIEEECLESCNEFKSRDYFYTGDSVTVVVDPNTGEGRIKYEQ